jgi:hypothetical protein
MPLFALETTGTIGFWTIRIGDVIMILAVVLAPFVALWAQWHLQLRKEAQSRRLWVFKTLMATRASSMDVNHVQALNMIDVEFESSSKMDTEVRHAWKTYLDHLYTDQGTTPEATGVWNAKSSDFLAELLTKMRNALGYKFDFTYVKGRAYIPMNINAEDALVLGAGKKTPSGPPSIYSASVSSTGAGSSVRPPV